MTTEQLLLLVREGDIEARVSANKVLFRHVDGRGWMIRFETPREARGWFHMVTL